jgi:hypothetical protein
MPSMLYHHQDAVVACESCGREKSGSAPGYSFLAQETGGRKLEITPRKGITEKCLAHAINRTCHSDFENCKFLHTGITKCVFITAEPLINHKGSARGGGRG